MLRITKGRIKVTIYAKQIDIIIESFSEGIEINESH
jgi:hypothetical protein